MQHHSQEAIQFTLEHFKAFYDDEECLADFYNEGEGRCFFLLEVA